MVYLILLLSFLLVGVVGTFTSKYIKSRIWGTLGVVGLGMTAVALAVSSLKSSTFLGIFSHPVFGRVEFLCDPLSAWFLLIVGVLFVLGAVYGNGYLAHYESNRRQENLHWLMFIVTLGGLFILFTTQNMIVFLLGWEMMAIGSFFAVIYEYDHPQVLKAGLNYFVQSHIAVLLITFVFVWAMSVSGRTTFDGLVYFFAHSSTKVQIVAMSMLIAGFGFKAGIVPFHSWLPYAHPAAPSHISALMSGVIVKAGIYGIVRFGSMLSGAEAQMPIGVVLLVLGIISGLYGIINAAEHRDFKRMLAYCTIENIGIICMALGIGFMGLAMENVYLTFLGFGGALLHTLNHAVFKSLLFFGAGNVYVTVHTRNMEELGGLGRYMPRTALIFLIGSLAIGGLPPMGGFISEFMIYSGFLEGFRASSLAVSILMAAAGCALAVIGGASMLAFTKTYGVIFLGEARKSYKHEPREVGKMMLVPAYVIIGIIFAVLIFAAPLVAEAFSISASVFGVELWGEKLEVLNGLVERVGIVARVMIVVMIAVLLFVIIRNIVAMHRPSREAGTWGCGYAKPIAGIQYTGKSFAKTLVDMCHAILPSTTRYTPITTEEIFPKDRAHMSADMDLVDYTVINAGVRGLDHVLEVFQFIQNGNLQRYIVYGLVYIMVLVASVLIF